MDSFDRPRQCVSDYAPHAVIHNDVYMYRHRSILNLLGEPLSLVHNNNNARGVGFHKTVIPEHARQ